MAVCGTDRVEFVHTHKEQLAETELHTMDITCVKRSQTNRAYQMCERSTGTHSSPYYSSSKARISRFKGQQVPHWEI